jgi:ketosteroid isomerase-like protein
MEPSIRQPVVDIAMELSDLQVHVYTNSAFAAGSNALKGTYKGQHLSGKYRFTDTWVKRNGKCSS